MTVQTRAMSDPENDGSISCGHARLRCGSFLNICLSLLRRKQFEMFVVMMPGFVVDLFWFKTHMPVPLVCVHAHCFFFMNGVARQTPGTSGQLRVEVWMETRFQGAATNEKVVVETVSTVFPTEIGAFARTAGSRTALKSGAKAVPDGFRSETSDIFFQSLSSEKTVRNAVAPTKTSNLPVLSGPTNSCFVSVECTRKNRCWGVIDGKSFGVFPCSWCSANRGMLGEGDGPGALCRRSRGFHLCAEVRSAKRTRLPVCHGRS